MKKTFRFTIAPSKTNNMAGWSSTIEAHTMKSALTKLKERKHDVKKIKEIEAKHENCACEKCRRFYFQGHAYVVNHI